MNILFVCTGNTCRSPMAAAIMQHLCNEDGLDIRIESAGLLAADGEPATKEAILALAELEISLEGHKSQPVTEELIKKSDLIITMTEAHKMLLADLAGEKTRTICELADIDGEISDPYGGDLEDYKETANKLYIALSHIEDNFYQILSEEENNEQR